MRALVIAIIIAVFCTNCILQPVQAVETHSYVSLPVPGTMVHLSPAYNPSILKGIKVNPDNPFKFDFVMDIGDVGAGPRACPTCPGQPQGVAPTDLKSESQKLIKYFLAAITIPEKDLWVNLSPYEKDRIIPDAFGQTEMGRDLLAQDYMLKQITASLIYPEDEIGKKFWKRVYEEAAKKFGTTNIPVNTFNKVWIMPDKAVVYENAKAGTAYVVESRLKVMLEEDYLAMDKNTVGAGLAPAQNNNDVRATARVAPTNINQLGSQIIREVVIPALTKEINQGQNFAHLRQVYNSLILAQWYKKKIKDSILNQVYANKNKIKGTGYDRSILLPMPTRGHDFSRVPKQVAKQERVDSESIPGKSPNDVELIYQQYLQAFKKGAYNLIKEEQDLVTKKLVPKKYFSGGALFSTVDFAMVDTVDGKNLGNQKRLITGVVSIQDAGLPRNDGSYRVIIDNTVMLTKNDLEIIAERQKKRVQLMSGLSLKWKVKYSDLDLAAKRELIDEIVERRWQWYQSENITSVFTDKGEILITKEVLREEIAKESILFVLEEIIKNAFDAHVVHASTGSIRLRIRESPDGKYVIEVMDDGIGINFDRTNKDSGWFVVANRRHDFQYQKEGGRGIGVLWSQVLIELHGGTLEFLPADQDYKTTVRITLPQHSITGRVSVMNNAMLTIDPIAAGRAERGFGRIIEDILTGAGKSLDADIVLDDQGWSNFVRDFLTMASQGPDKDIINHDFELILQRFFVPGNIAAYKDFKGSFNVEQLVSIIQRLHAFALNLHLHGVRIEMIGTKMYPFPKLLSDAYFSYALNLDILEGSGWIGDSWRGVVASLRTKRNLNDNKINQIGEWRNDSSKKKAILDFYGINLTEYYQDRINLELNQGKDALGSVDSRVIDAASKYIARLIEADLNTILNIHSFLVALQEYSGIKFARFLGQRGADGLAILIENKGRKSVLKINTFYNQFVEAKAYHAAFASLSDADKEGKVLPKVEGFYPLGDQGTNIGLPTEINQFIEGQSLEDIAAIRSPDYLSNIKQWLNDFVHLHEQLLVFKHVDRDSTNMSNIIVDASGRMRSIDRRNIVIAGVGSTVPNKEMIIINLVRMLVGMTFVDFHQAGPEKWQSVRSFVGDFEPQQQAFVNSVIDFLEKSYADTVLDLDVFFREWNSFMSRKAAPGSAMKPGDLAMIGNNTNEVRNNKTGGIDLTSDKALTVQNNGQAVKFKIDPAQLARWRESPGVTFDIVNLQPMDNLEKFLGLSPAPSTATPIAF